MNNLGGLSADVIINFLELGTVFESAGGGGGECPV